MSPRARFRYGHVRIEDARAVRGITLPPPSSGGGQGHGIGQGVGGGRDGGVGQGRGGGRGHGVTTGASLPPGLLSSAVTLFAAKPAFVPAAALAPYKQTVLASRPTGYWTLDETSGTTAFDSSGNGFDATLNAVPTLNVAPLITVRKAMTFNGSTQAGQTARQVFLPAFSGHISLEAWVKTVTAGGMILCADDSSFVRFFQWAVGTTVVELVLFSGGVGTTLDFNINVRDNVRHHLLTTYDGSVAHLYVDGVEVGTGLAAVNKLDNGSGTFATCIAKRNSGGSDSSFYTGTLDECAVYERVLTQADATAHWLAGK